MSAAVKRVAVYQNDPAFGAVEANLAAARSALSGVRADLIVLPELFASGYQFASADEVSALAEPAPGGPTCAALEAIAKESRAARPSSPASPSAPRTAASSTPPRSCTRAGS
jgi:predicted amidohydrolase